MTIPDQILSLLLARKIKASIASTTTGPRLTRYKLAVAPEIPLGRISRLGPDLSALLSIPVSVTVNQGVFIDVPRQDPQPVPLLPLLARLRRPLDLALGVDQQGQPVIVNLGELPHLLVAGRTGAGKSVSLNCIILSLLGYPPDKVRLALIDLKQVELSAYEGLPHLVRPVARSIEAAYDLIDLLGAEIMRRYDDLRDRGLKEWDGTRIVLVVDELADLVLACPVVVRALVKVAQLGRAAGVHLIAASQRPDSSVISGLLKSQVPARLSFAVATAVDSRVLMGQKGAESLLGRGDGLFMEPGGNMIRLQGAVPGDILSDPSRTCWACLPTDPFPDPRPPYVPPVYNPIVFPVAGPVTFTVSPVVTGAALMLRVWAVLLVLGLIWAVLSSLK